MTDYAQIGRRTTTTLFTAQALGSAGFIASATVSSIVGADLSGNPAWAGVPSAVYLLGSAFSAIVWGYAMDRIGRRGGLVLGFAIGVVGAGLAAATVVARSFPLFLGGLALVGTANAAMQLGRFAAAEVHPPSKRGRAISNVIVGGTVGAILGPMLVGPMGRAALRAGIDELAGPYLAGLILFSLASLVVFFRLRPDPRDTGREIAALYPEVTPHQGATRSIPEILREPAAIVAVVAMVSGQMVMAMLMSITALHMRGSGHALGDISLVISSHVVGMYAFSVISGRLADSIGRAPVIMVGAGTLVVATLLSPLSSNVFPLAFALFLLGLGWNFCYVGGSSLLADQLSPAERARTQGFNDLLIGLASAGGSFGSGLVFATVGYEAMGVVGAAASLIPFTLVIWWQWDRRRLAAVQ